MCSRKRFPRSPLTRRSGAGRCGSAGSTFWHRPAPLCSPAPAAQTQRGSSSGEQGSSAATVDASRRMCGAVPNDEPHKAKLSRAGPHAHSRTICVPLPPHAFAPQPAATLPYLAEHRSAALAAGPALHRRRLGCRRRRRCRRRIRAAAFPLAGAGCIADMDSCEVVRIKIIVCRLPAVPLPHYILPARPAAGGASTWRGGQDRLTAAPLCSSKLTPTSEIVSKSISGLKQQPRRVPAAPTRRPSPWPRRSSGGGAHARAGRPCLLWR